MARLVALDTQICVWGIRENFKKSQTDEKTLLSAASLIKSLSQESAEIAIPSAVLAELLIPLKDSKKFLGYMTKHFMILDFDCLGAQKYAEIYRANKGNGKMAHEKSCGRINRVIKNDHIIVATCASHGVEVLYSNDHSLRNFCDTFVEACDIPTLAKQEIQESLFEV